MKAAPVTISGCAPDLERMVRNLLENAIRHSPERGEAHVTASEEQGRLEVEVADQGVGISAGERERVFEPFYRGGSLRASGATGAGLGLAIVREIARAHGGDVTLAAKEAEHGARFIVALPVHGEAA